MLLYQMASGKRPFHKDTIGGTLHSILLEEPKPIGQVTSHAPRFMRAL